MLVAKNISKRFAGITALNDVSLELLAGKVNAIIGENGAGKSTLMKILSGVHTQYEGAVYYNGRKVKFSGANDAEKSGIAIIHQELNLVPYLTVSENIFLGREITNLMGMLDKRQMREKTRQVLSRLNLSVSPDAKIAELKVGQQQLIEIARALHSQASVIIMDEPTSAISDKEVENLFSVIRDLKDEGRTVVYISHKLKELFELADRYIVLRDGMIAGSGEMKDTSPDDLIQKMTGRQLAFGKTGSAKHSGEELLAVKEITLRHPLLRMTRLVDRISFTLYKGEILGLYGLMGAGRTELMETIFGLHPGNSCGEIFVNGKKQRIKSPAQAIEAGIALVPEDRKLQGLILDQTVRSNISIAILRKLQKWGLVIHARKERDLTRNYIGRLGIKTSSANNQVKNLSGGNQQKIVLAKWLATGPKLLLLDEPTRGIDVSAKAEIYKLMKSLAADGMGIVMVSSELPEILAVSDRVLVMCEGALTATMPIEEATEPGILRHAIQKGK